MSRHIVIGDIHGCYDELCELLDRIGPTGSDRIVALGDLVDRGPQVAQVLEFFRDTPNAVSLLGNHERKHLRCARGESQYALGQLITRRQLGADYDAWLREFARYLRLLDLPEAVLVHGFLEPGVPIEKQHDRIVYGTLVGEAYLTQKYPGPWYDHYDGPRPVVCGHHDYRRMGEPLIREGKVYAIDTGCVHGGRLTALILPDFEVVSVPARADHWKALRRKFESQTRSLHTGLGFGWSELDAFADTNGNPNLPGYVRSEGARCAQIADECDQVARAVLERVRQVREEILESLRQTPDWAASCAEERKRRFVTATAHHPFGEVIRATNTQEMHISDLYRHAGSPGDLLQMAKAMGIKTEVGETAKTRDLAH